MSFQTELVDALYVNWAVPRELLPTPPAALELESVLDGGRTLAFVTLVLFRQHGLRHGRWPWVRLGFPQCNLRLPVRDAERVASHWLLHQLVPAWAVPLGRWVGRQPVSGAILRGRPARDVEGGWTWEVLAGTRLALRAWPAAGATAAPRLGDWSRTVAFFRERPRAFVGTGPRLARLDASIDRAEALPLAVEVECADWLRLHLPGVAAESWSAPHCAFLVPSTRLEIERTEAPAPAIPARVPAASLPA